MEYNTNTHTKKGEQQMYSVYKISIGEWFYIGCSKRVEKRISQHLSNLKHDRHGNPKLSEAFKNNPNLQYEILREVKEEKEAYKTERALIKKEKTNHYCCNIVFVEEHHLKGKKVSKATKAKISKIHKGKKLSEEHKEKISQAKKGIPISEETKEKMSKARKGRTSNRKGVTLSEEHKEKLRQYHLNHKQIYHCPYCDKSNNNRGAIATHIRYCKHKPQELE